MIVFSFFDKSTNMVKPWAAAGYECYCLDIQHTMGDKEIAPNIHVVGIDLLKEWASDYWRFCDPSDIAICFFFPPCTHLANSGARWFSEKGLDKLIEGLTLVSLSIKIANELEAPYFIENPQGQLSTYWRKPDYKFEPCDYGDSYTKKTHLWVGNGFVMPLKTNPVQPIIPAPGFHSQDIWIEQSGRKLTHKNRGNLRSETSIGFAKAVFEANVNIKVGL